MIDPFELLNPVGERRMMELFFKYDWERLNAFRQSQVQNHIDIYTNEWVTAFSFPEVGYFNYAILNHETRFPRKQMDEIQAYYLDRRIRGHKIILSKKIAEHYHDRLKARNYEKQKNIVKTNYDVGQKLNCTSDPGLEFEPLSHENVLKYTSVYLDSFEAEGKNYRHVAKNFKMLLSIPNLESFIMRSGRQPVGVIVLFQKAHEYFLAGGAVLPLERNHSYHKSGLLMRIRKCLDDPKLKNIISWAYEDSISLKNIGKMNMDEVKQYYVYQHTTDSVRDI